MGRENGFSLVEILITMALVAIISIAFLRFQSTSTRTIASDQTVVLRDDTFYDVEAKSRNAAIIQASLALNPAGSQLNICANGTGGLNGCTATNIATPETFNLSRFSPAVGGELAAGTASAPKSYRLAGVEFQATARFVAMCPLLAASCQTAAYISTGITLAPVGAPVGGPPISVKSTRRLFPILVKDIIGPVSQSCAVATDYAYGFDAVGKPLCKTPGPLPPAPSYAGCPLHTRQVGNNPNGSPNCVSHRLGIVGNCTFPTYQIGVYADGAPICRSFTPYHRCANVTPNLPFVSKEAGCESTATTTNVMEHLNFFYALPPGDSY